LTGWWLDGELCSALLAVREMRMRRIIRKQKPMMIASIVDDDDA